MGWGPAYDDLRESTSLSGGADSFDLDDNFRHAIRTHSDSFRQYAPNAFSGVFSDHKKPHNEFAAGVKTLMSRQYPGGIDETHEGEGHTCFTGLDRHGVRVETTVKTKSDDDTGAILGMPTESNYEHSVNTIRHAK